LRPLYLIVRYVQRGDVFFVNFCAYELNIYKYIILACPCAPLDTPNTYYKHILTLSFYSCVVCIANTFYIADMLRRISSGRAIIPPGSTVAPGGGGIPKKTASAPAGVVPIDTITPDGYQPVTAAVLKALKGEQVLAWCSGHQRRDSPNTTTAANGNANVPLVPDRKRLLSRKGPAPGFPALLIITQARRTPTLRIHLLAEKATYNARPRSWNLTELRLVDGLGFAVKIARDFALTFSGNARPLYWRCDSSEYRAKFLWSLLQICAGKLPGKAPPSQRLSLLELQQFANEVKLKPLKRKSDSDADNNNNNNNTRPPRSPPPQRVLRTASEPQAGALHDLVVRAEAERNNKDNNGNNNNNYRLSMDGPPVARPPAEKAEKDLSVYELAFALAAKRVGARPPIFKRSRPQSPSNIAAAKDVRTDDHEHDDGNNNGSKNTDDGTTEHKYGVPVRKVSNGYALQVPRQRSMGGNNNTSTTTATNGIGKRRTVRPHKDQVVAAAPASVGLCDGASPTAMLVARCKAQEERRQYRLEASNNNNNSNSVPDLSVFESWTRHKMHEIETRNMKETVNIEQKPASGFSVDGYRSMLIDSVRDGESWLKPTAERANVVQLKELLEEVLDPRIWNKGLGDALRLVADNTNTNTTTNTPVASPGGTTVTSGSASASDHNSNGNMNIALVVDGEDPFTNCNIKGSPMQALSWTSAISAQALARSPGL